MTEPEHHRPTAVWPNQGTLRSHAAAEPFERCGCPSQFDRECVRRGVLWPRTLARPPRSACRPSLLDGQPGADQQRGYLSRSVHDTFTTPSALNLGTDQLDVLCTVPYMALLTCRHAALRADRPKGPSHDHCSGFPSADIAGAGGCGRLLRCRHRVQRSGQRRCRSRSDEHCAERRALLHQGRSVVTHERCLSGWHLGNGALVLVATSECRIGLSLIMGWMMHITVCLRRCGSSSCDRHHDPLQCGRPQEALSGNSGVLRRSVQTISLHADRFSLGSSSRRGPRVAQRSERTQKRC